MTKKDMIKVDKQKCIGCGTCAAICGKVFRLNEEELKAEVINPEADDACVEEAMNSCPVDAIFRD